jgi:cytidylate kinase
MPVITISREAGAGGSSAAALLAVRLGCEVLDSSIVAEIARRLQLPARAVEEADEHPVTLVDRLMGAVRYLAPAGLWVASRTDVPGDPLRVIPNVTEELIREAARMRRVVIVGRGSAFVLADEPGSLHVFLRAPEPLRLRTLMDRYSLDESAARQRMHTLDAERAAYVRQLYHRDWRDPAHFDLVINTGRVGVGGAVDLMVAAVGAGGVHPVGAAPGERGAETAKA